jgi:hypothetical protein
MMDMVQTPDTAHKITGNVSEEITEAAFRLASTQLVRAIRNKIVNKLPPNSEAAVFLGTAVGEAVLSFALAAALELFPTENWKEIRGCLASNLRIQSYEFLGDFLLGFTTEIDAQVAIVAKAIDGKGRVVTPPAHSAGSATSHA